MMLEKCSNPSCSALFRYLHQGRLFVLDTSDDAGAGGAFRNERLAAHRLRYFWLCDNCHRSMTVVSEQGWEIKVVPFTALQPEETSWKASLEFLDSGFGAVQGVRRKLAV
jgi:hypothetical protein